MAFKTLKKHLTVTPVLLYQVLDPSLQYQLWVDANDFACGDALAKQAMVGHWLPVKHMTHWFSAPDLNYSATKVKLLEVLLGLERWCYYLLGPPFVVHLDHTSLQCLFS